MSLPEPVGSRWKGQIDAVPAPQDSGLGCLFGFGSFVFLAAHHSFPKQGEVPFSGNVRV